MQLTPQAQAGYQPQEQAQQPVQPTPQAQAGYQPQRQAEVIEVTQASPAQNKTTVQEATSPKAQPQTHAGY